MKITLVAAMDLGHGIGFEGRIPWHLPRDLRRFRDLSMGKPVVMGRKTHESTGQPLRGRETIVLSRDPAYRAAGCRVATSLADGLAIASSLGAPEAIVAGGGPIYDESLSLADELRLTLVMGVFAADAHFPRHWADAAPWQIDVEAWHEPDERHAHAHVFFRATRPARARVGV